MRFGVRRLAAALSLASLLAVISARGAFPANKLPHSKALRVTNIFRAMAGEGRSWLPTL